MSESTDYTELIAVAESQGFDWTVINGVFAVDDEFGDYTYAGTSWSKLELPTHPTS